MIQICVVLLQALVVIPHFGPAVPIFERNNGSYMTKFNFKAVIMSRDWLVIDSLSQRGVMFKHTL